MIILFNISCSPHRLNGYGRPNLKHFDRMDVFKYCLSSYAVLSPLVSKYILYVQLEKGWEHRKDDLNDFILKNIPNDKLELHWHRNTTVEEWQNVYNDLEKINDKVVWFAGNDDHIFVDYDLNCLSGCINALEESAPLSACFYSHWFETIRMAGRHNASLHPNGHCVNFPWAIHDSIRMVRKEVIKHYFFEKDFRYQNGNFWRWDRIKEFSGNDIMLNTFIPTRELCRHFDGYSHVGNLFNFGPPLEIPPGFFENTMKIRYGWNDGYKEDCVNVNPMNPNLKCVDPVNGVDSRCTLDKIPLFWAGHISEFIINKDINEEEMHLAWENDFKNRIKLTMNTYFESFDENNPPPINWFEIELTRS